MENKVYKADIVEKILPEKLKQLRKKSGLTTAQVGKTLNKTPSAITLWETGKALPDVNVLLKLCEIYKVSDLNEFIDNAIILDNESLSRSETELIKLWRAAPNSIKAAIKTILKQCNK